MADVFFLIFDSHIWNKFIAPMHQIYHKMQATKIKKKSYPHWHRIIIYLRELTFSATLVWQKTLPSVRLAMVWFDNSGPICISADVQVINRSVRPSVENKGGQTLWPRVEITIFGERPQGARLVAPSAASCQPH
jgi:hypothetical protein